MDFKRAIAHPKLRNGFIVVKWSKGYQSTEIWYRERLLKTITGIKALQNKVVFNDDEVGKVEVFLVENPFRINIKVDDIHSRENVKYPLKKIKTIANWIIPAVIIHLLVVIAMVNAVYFNKYGVAEGDRSILNYHAFFFVYYIVSFTLIRLSNPK
jgi:hypothetical protein